MRTHLTHPPISPRRARRLLAACASAVAFIASTAGAQVVTIGSGTVLNVGSRSGPTTTGFTGFTHNGVATINGANTQATLTTNANSQAGTVWTGAAQTITNANGFTANFTYTASGDKAADGATFTIQNSAAGSAALGHGGGGLGYGNIGTSASYQMNIFGGSGSVLNVNGATEQDNGGLRFNSTLPGVNIASGNPIAVTLNYTAGVLVETLHDTVTNGYYSSSYALDLNTLLGGTSGFVGFTGGTGGFAATQVISNFSISTGAANNQAFAATQLIVQNGGLVTGTGGSITVTSFQVSGGAVSLAGTAVNAGTFTQTGGNVALSTLAIASGHSYSLQNGAASINALSVLSGGSLSLSNGTLTTPSFSNAGTFSWTGGTLKITGSPDFSIDDSSVGSGFSLLPDRTLLVANGTLIPASSTFTLNGGVFSTGSLTIDGTLSLKTGNFILTNQTVEISSSGLFGKTLFVGPDLHVQVAQSTSIDVDGRIVVAGGTYTSSAVENDGAISVIDGEFTTANTSTNNSYFDAIRSFITFGTGESDRMTNFGTMNLIDTNIYGDLHNTSGSLIRTAGNVVFFGNLTSDGAVLANTGSVEFFGGGNSLAAVSGGGNMTVQDSAVLTSDAVTLNALTINGLHTLRAGSSASKVNSLSINHVGNVYSGKLDLTTDKLIVEATDAADKAAKIADLNAAITSGANGIQWNGNGIISTNAANDHNHYGVGVFDNAVLQKSSFGGQPTDTNSIFITLAHLGDANDNGIVDIQDLTIVANNWQQSRNNWARGDLNRSGLVDIQDLTIVANNWQQTSSFPLSPASISLQSVPEPASLLFFSLLTPLLVRRQKPRAAKHSH